MSTEPDALADEGLFDIEAPPPVSLADRFGVPPFSLLDRRAGYWLDRKRKWLQLGIQSELGRSASLLGGTPAGGQGLAMGDAILGATRVRNGAYGAQAKTNPETGLLEYETTVGATSIFDPVVCELAYRWHTREGDRILDPFAGGSVRGLVASILRRQYTGVDLRAEQVAANETQAHIGDPAYPPRWITGDSTRLLELVPPAGGYDMVFSCPPYGDLEVYSDDPRDLSTLPADQFDELHAQVIRQACQLLSDDRFAVWVISDIRDRRGAYRHLVGDTVAAFQAAGLAFYNEGVLLDPVGSGAVRAGKLFNASRKLVRMHQKALVFVKGDPKKATRRLDALELEAQQPAVQP